MTDHLFREPAPGHIKHTIATKALVLMPMLAPWSQMGMYEVGPAKMRVCNETWQNNLSAGADNISRWLMQQLNGQSLRNLSMRYVTMNEAPLSDDPTNMRIQGFNIANDTEKIMFDYFEDHPDRMNRFKSAMSFLQTFPGLENSYVAKGFDWAALGKATVVDVGGSHGKVSIDLAKEYPDLHFVVQDLPKVIEEAKKELPEELAGRIEFMAHDFFTEQPVKNADIFYLRWVLHDWSDKYCIKILRSLIPAFKPGVKLVLSERCLEPPCTLPLRQERWNRCVFLHRYSTY